MQRVDHAEALGGGNNLFCAATIGEPSFGDAQRTDTKKAPPAPSRHHDLLTF